MQVKKKPIRKQKDLFKKTAVSQRARFDNHPTSDDDEIDCLSPRPNGGKNKRKRSQKERVVYSDDEEFEVEEVESHSE